MQEIRICTKGSFARARKRKKQPTKIIFNNPRSSIKPEIAPDPKHARKNSYLEIKECFRIILNYFCL